MEVESQIDLLDSDMVKIREIFHNLNRKYADKADTKKNLLSLVREAEDQFRVAGFEVSVSMSKAIAYAMGLEPTPEMPSMITFSIDARVEEEYEFDYDKMAWEANKDLLPDGVAKKFLDQGGTQEQSVDVDATVGEPEREDE